MDFQGFGKIPRLFRDIVITEKIDGTNGCICIAHRLESEIDNAPIATCGDYIMWAGSRKRWIQPENDNHGFAKWATENCEELFKLGPGRHFGEWWGQGINRGYGLKEKRFSLFNVSKWSDDTVRPACCHVVPVLYQGSFDTDTIKLYMDALEYDGSYAAPGFKQPEGIVVFHTAGNLLFKATIKNDDKPKGIVK